MAQRSVQIHQIIGSVIDSNTKKISSFIIQQNEHENLETPQATEHANQKN